MEELSPKQAAEMLADGSAIIVDVREHEELADAELKGALHIPMGEIADRVSELDPAQTTIVMCKLGGRSAMVCDFLAGQGFNKLYNLTGGIMGWASEVDGAVLKQ